jgi:hypothetical protein
MKEYREVEFELHDEFLTLMLASRLRGFNIRETAPGYYFIGGWTGPDSILT